VEYKRYGWLSALWGLLAGSFVALFPFFAISLMIGWLHLVPLTFPVAAPGTGWPWRIDGWWSVLADIGPLLLLSTLIAGCVGFYVHGSTGRRAARWPIVLCAALVGWIPIANAHHAGLLGIGTGLGFVAMWWTTRQTADLPRLHLPQSHRRAFAAGAGIVLVSLTACSLSYGALHPIRAVLSGDPEAATLRNGSSDLLPVQIYDDGPLPARLLGITLPGNPGLGVAAIELPGPLTSGPTIDSLYQPAGTPRIAAGGTISLWLRLSGPPVCLSPTASIDHVDVRFEVAGTGRTQAVILAPEPLQVLCRAVSPAGRHR
jgi:hypothetical protein